MSYWLWFIYRWPLAEATSLLSHKLPCWSVTQKVFCFFCHGLLALKSQHLFSLCLSIVSSQNLPCRYYMQDNVMKPMYKETSQTQDISTKYLQLFTIYLQVFTISLQYIYNFLNKYNQPHISPSNIKMKLSQEHRTKRYKIYLVLLCVSINIRVRIHKTKISRGNLIWAKSVWVICQQKYYIILLMLKSRL